MKKLRYLAWILLVCLIVLPCVSMAENTDEPPYPYEYDTRYKWDDVTGTYTFDGTNSWGYGFCTATQEVYAPLLINTQHSDGTITTVEKTVKVGEIEYGFRTYWCYATEDTYYLTGLSLTMDEYYPVFSQIPVQYGGVQLNNSITYSSMPIMKGFSMDEEGDWTVAIKGGEYLLRYISEITYNEEHEVLNTVMTEIDVEYDFEATEFIDAEHPDG